MPRPCKLRKISSNPIYTCFKPHGIPKEYIEKVEIFIDEYEALKLTNIQGLSNEQGATKMGISAPTYNRLIKSAYKKITDAFVNGKGIRIYNKNGEHKCN